MHQKKTTNAVNLPILLLNGKDDPVIGGHAGYKQTIADLSMQGFDNITHISFDRIVLWRLLLLALFSLIIFISENVYYALKECLFLSWLNYMKM